MSTRTPVIGDVASVVAAYFRAPIAALEAVAPSLGAAIAAESEPLVTSRIDEVVLPFAEALLDVADVPVYGAGFIAAIDLLSDARSHLSWWQGEDRRRLVLAAQTVNKEHIDYSALEWFRIPVETGHAHVAGPYVDYLCSDEYMITIAAPVIVDGVTVGVVGLDLLIDDIERALLPQLRSSGIAVAVVNAASRVLVSSHPSHAAGDAIRDGGERFACDGIALDVLVIDAD